MTDYKLVPSFNDGGDETGFYTREPDGISGMTVTALAELCGVSQPAITQLLSRIRESDPITNDLQDRLKPLAGKELALITNDERGRLLIPDEDCWTILGYYAFDARQYAGKATALRNFDRIGGAGMRLFIWGQTGFVPEVLRPQLKTTTSVYIDRSEVPVNDPRSQLTTRILVVKLRPRLLTTFAGVVKESGYIHMWLCPTQ